MSVIFGLMANGGTVIGDQLADAMVDACSLWPHDRVGIASDSAWFIGCKQHYNTPESSRARQPIACRDGRYQLVFDGRIDNREEVAQAVGRSLADDTSDEDLIIGAYSQFGERLGEYLIGDFAIGIVDTFTNSLFLIRDHMGVRPLFIARSSQGLAFTSNIAALLTLPWVDRSANDQWIADLLAARKVDIDKTIYRGIETLPPAHWLRCSTDGSEQERYWQLQLKTGEQSRSSAEYVRDFKTLLNQAVRCRLRSYTPVASEMSGGLDSTTVTALASNILLERGERMQAFSHVMPESNLGRVFPFRDESNYMQAMCEKHRNLDHIGISGEDRGIVAPLEWDIQIHSGPSRNHLTLTGEELLTNLQARGIRTLLSGFGGDQMVSSHGHGWENEYIQRRDWAGLRRELQHHDMPASRKLFRYLKWRFPLLGKIASRLEGERWNRATVSRMMSPELAARTGYPERAEANPTRRRVGTVREQEHDVVLSPHLVYRLEDCTVGAGAYGVEYRYPLLDIRLMQYYLDLPTSEKIGSGVQRRMIRNATVGLLPEKIRTRNDKSRATIPTVFARFLRDREALLAKITELETDTALADYVPIGPVVRYLQKAAADNQSRKRVKLSSIIDRVQLGLWLKTRL